MNLSKLNRLAGIALALLFAPGAFAQTADSIKYDHQDIFGPITWPVTGGSTRSANGLPGPRYWQNRADYLIHVKLGEGEQDTTITGDVTIS